MKYVFHILFLALSLGARAGRAQDAVTLMKAQGGLPFEVWQVVGADLVFDHVIVMSDSPENALAMVGKWEKRNTDTLILNGVRYLRLKALEPHGSGRFAHGKMNFLIKPGAAASTLFVSNGTKDSSPSQSRKYVMLRRAYREVYSVVGNAPADFDGEKAIGLEKGIADGGVFALDKMGLIEFPSLPPSQEEWPGRVLLMDPRREQLFFGRSLVIGGRDGLPQLSDLKSLRATYSDTPSPLPGAAGPDTAIEFDSGGQSHRILVPDHPFSRARVEIDEETHFGAQHRIHELSVHHSCPEALTALKRGFTDPRMAD
jgi:hypothetical protein